MKHLIFAILCLVNLIAHTQITAFSETFESANSLTLVNGTQANKWFRGTANQCVGTAALYVSNNSSAYSYTITSTSIVHAYFDVAIPAGSTNVTLTFQRKVAGENIGTTLYDYIQVWSTINTFAPTAGTAVTANANRVLLGNIQNQTTCGSQAYTLTGVAGTTRRIIFTWRNDASGGVSPPGLIDNITVTYTTASTPPTCASLSSPANGATNTSLTQTITWAATSGATGYDVYFGTSPTPPLVSSNQAGTTYNPGTLTAGTTYYHQIIPRNANGPATGCSTWSFTTTTPPANDLCSGATALACATSNLAGTTVNSQVETPPASVSTSSYGVWYCFTGDGGQTTISSTAAFDHEMTILTGSSCGSFAQVATVDVNLANQIETYTFTTTNGQQYYVWIAHYLAGNTSTGTFTISRTCTPPCTTPTNGGTLTSSKSNTTVNDATTLTTSGNEGSITLIEWSYNNFSSVAGSASNPANPYTIRMNVQQTQIWFRSTSQNGACPSGNSNIVSVNLRNAPTYSIGITDGDHITNVTFANINNSSTNDGDAYQDFTSQIIELTKGEPYQLNVSAANTLNPGQGYAAWIDWNGDGTFQTSENVLQKAPANSTSQVVNVPSDAITGDVLMRVLSVWNATPSNDAYYSTGYGYGEIEEYTVRLSSPTPLPVELIQFEGSAYPQWNVIKWATASEHNSSHYDLQVSFEGTEWRSITNLPAAGNSNEILKYSYIDWNQSEISYYKLVQYDIDGNYKEYGPISVVKMMSEKKVVKYVNLMGQEINPLTTTGLVIEVYSDGSIRRSIR